MEMILVYSVLMCKENKGLPGVKNREEGGELWSSI